MKMSMRRVQRQALAVTLVGSALLATLAGGAQAVPPQASADTQACEARLAAMGVSFTPVADRSEGGLCVVTGAVVLHDRPSQPDPSLSPADPMMTCPLAVAVAAWRRNDVERAARDILGVGVRQIDHLGVYACRNVNNQAGGRPSAHARAAAIDVAGFRLSDGREIGGARLER